MTMLPPLGPMFGGGQLDVEGTGLALLGQTKMASAAAASAAIDIEPRHFLMLSVLCTGMSASGQPAIRFGATPGAPVDSGVAYWSRNMMSASNGAALPGNFGNDPRPGANRLLLGYNRTDALNADISELGGTLHRMMFLTVWNLPGTRTTVQFFASIGTGAAATVGRIWSGWGQWSSTSPIRRIQLVSMDDVATLSADTGLLVWGSTLP